MIPFIMSVCGSCLKRELPAKVELSKMLRGYKYMEWLLYPAPLRRLQQDRKSGILFHTHPVHSTAWWMTLRLMIFGVDHLSLVRRKGFDVTTLLRQSLTSHAIVYSPQLGNIVVVTLPHPKERGTRNARGRKENRKRRSLQMSYQQLQQSQDL